MKVKFIILLLTQVCWCDRLISTVVIFRHGQRTPLMLGNNDPYKNESLWPVPFGELTNLGIQQAHALGRWLRTRYASFMPSKYASKDIAVYSSDVDRTIMSAQSVLAGLYPPFQPIPVHTIPKRIDFIISAKRKCAKYKKLLQNLLNESYFINMDLKYEEYYSKFSSKFDMNISTFYGNEFLYDSLWTERLLNFTLPDWLTEEDLNVMKNMLLSNFFIRTYNNEISRLETGGLFNEILHYFESFSLTYDRKSSFNIAPEKARKMLMISAHDLNIYNILNVFKHPNIGFPQFCDAILFELKADDQHHYVTVYYKNLNKLTKISIDQCGIKCNLKSFINLLNPVAVDEKEWIRECDLI